MKAKRWVGLVSLAIIFLAGVYAVLYLYTDLGVTYDGVNTDVTELYAHPEEYDLTDQDGVASIIVDLGLDKTRAVNNVAAVVFDYRCFDTIGESFILLAAISGSFIILRTNKEKKEEDELV